MHISCGSFRDESRELIEHLMVACTRGGRHMLDWLDDRVKLTKDDVLKSGSCTSTLSDV